MRVRFGEVVSTCIAASVADWYICDILGSISAVVQLRLIDIVQSEVSCVHTGIMLRLFTKKIVTLFSII